MKCQVCKKEKAEYAIYRTVDDKKVWLEVCDKCEKMIQLWH